MLGKAAPDEKEPAQHASQARPMQVHLDVASIEHDSDGPRSASGRPGLLSHYLQLAEIDAEPTLQLATFSGVRRRPIRASRYFDSPASPPPAALAEPTPSPGDASTVKELDGPATVEEHRAPSLRAPFSEVDLTRFLPFAQSSSGSRAGSVGKACGDVRERELLEGIAQLIQNQRFLCLLAEALMQFGSPLHHLEDNLSRMARRLHSKTSFTTMPGLILMAIEDECTHTSETRVIRCANGYDMHRLELTDRVFRSVSRGKMSVGEGTARLEEIMGAPPLFAWYWQVFDWGLSSWAVCLLAFSGSWWDSLAAFVLGLLVGALNLLAGRLKGYTNLFEVSASVLCGFLASCFSAHLCFAAVTLSATVVLLPGLIITTGVIELASRNMHAGTIRMFYGLTLAFVIAFGLDLGNNVFVEIFGPADRSSSMDLGRCRPVSQWWWWLAFPVCMCSICLLVNMHPRYWHSCVVVGGAMFAVFWLLVMHLNLTLIGPVVAAFVLGLAANLWGKLFKHNAYAVLLPGMMVLVPGSVGVRGFLTLFDGSGGAGSALVMQMVQTSLSIMTGLFASSFVIYPRGKKNSALVTI